MGGAGQLKIALCLLLLDIDVDPSQVDDERRFDGAASYKTKFNPE